MRKEFNCKNCNRVYIRDHTVKSTNFCSRKCYSDYSSVGMLNKEFNNWTVIDKAGKGKYICKCKCGFIKNNLTKHDLELNKTRNCVNCRNEIPDIIGKKYNKYTVIEYVGIKKTLKTFLCECECGKRKEINLNRLTYKSVGCLSCLKRQYVGDLSGDYFSSIKGGARRRNIDFNITKEYCWDLFLKQNKKCILSGVDISLKDKTASLDRINSKSGYIEGNIQWVHKDVNIMKMAFDQEYFIKFCHSISKNNENFSNSTPN